MCGIVGIFSYKHNVADQQPFIRWSLQTMHHRGPDSNGIYSNDENYIAGFVRLSIRDLSVHGDQPMTSACKKYVVSFNGEIYNTHVYKQRLQQLGVSFVSTTDTEVLLYALIHWGPGYVLQHFDGIFAFAFYNNFTNELIVARDRAGVKPLYIGSSSRGIIYSSQYDHIMAHPYCKNNNLDASAIGAYLSLGYIPENSGALSSTFMLPHGYYLVVNESGYSRHHFYAYSLDTLVAQPQSLEKLIEKNVQAQMVSDVPVGTFLSGGVDSPLVSYYANKKNPIQSFTIGVANNAMDESFAAAKYASILGTQHHCKTINATDLLQTIEDNSKAFSEPFADYSSIPTLILSKFARQHVTVALSGDGGDELFWGYPRNLRMLKEGMLFKHNKLMRFLSFTKEKVSGGTRIARRRHMQVPDFPAYYYRSLFIHGAEYWLPELFSNQIQDAFFLSELYKGNSASVVNADAIMNILRKLEFDIHLQRILLKVDRASMYHSLEVRVPLLSNDIINYSNTLHYTQAIQHGHGKYNLKQLLISKTNETLVMQPKKGFVIPIGDWLRNQLKNDVEDKLMNMPGELRPLFNRTALNDILKEHSASKHDWGWLIWSLYSLVNWHQHHRAPKTIEAFADSNYR